MCRPLFGGRAGQSEQEVALDEAYQVIDANNEIKRRVADDIALHENVIADSFDAKLAELSAKGLGVYEGEGSVSQRVAVDEGIFPRPD